MRDLLTSIKRRLHAPVEARDWLEERKYWRDRLQNRMRAHYGLALHPIQSEDATVPPPSLVQQIQTSNKSQPDVFFATGYRSACLYLEELQDHGIDPSRLECVLEFGVGLGRLIRHFFPFPAELHGCDVTGDALEFCGRTLGNRVQLHQNTELPRLPYADARFDFIYANSVFTHIPTAAAPQWIEELARVVKPGAYVIVTAYGASNYLRHLPERELDCVVRGSGILEWGQPDVRNFHVFYAGWKLRELWSTAFEVLEVRNHFKDQDHVILRRRAN